jgi:hypothetical protein
MDYRRLLYYPIEVTDKCTTENEVGASRGQIILTARDPQPRRSVRIIAIKIKMACSFSEL